MKSMTLLIILVLSMLGAPCAPEAQPSPHVHRIGFLLVGPPPGRDRNVDLAPLETMASTWHTTQAISSSHQVIVTTVRAWNMPPFVAIPLVVGPDATSQGQPGSQA